MMEHVHPWMLWMIVAETFRNRVLTYNYIRSISTLNPGNLLFFLQFLLLINCFPKKLPPLKFTRWLEFIKPACDWSGRLSIVFPFALLAKVWEKKADIWVCSVKLRVYFICPILSSFCNHPYDLDIVWIN